MSSSTRPAINVGRSTVYSKGGIVCSVSPLAASAGIGVLREGGNAFDAAVAVAAVEAVTIPAACGLGGEPFVLMYHAKSGKIHGLSGSGRAPLAASRDYFVSRGYEVMPGDGPLSAAIPGEVHAYEGILEWSGTRPLSKLLEPAIGYAEEGYPLPPRLGRSFTSGASRLSLYPDTRRTFTRDGKPYKEGDIFVQKDLARTLRRVAQGGAEEFYKGDTAREMARAFQAAGGLYTYEELAAHETEWYEPPISTTYRGRVVYETAPPSQGLLLLEMLNIMEGFDLAATGFYNAEAVHLMVEAKKLAFADRNAYMADPRFRDVPLAELVSKEFAERRRRRIDMSKAATEVQPEPLRGVSPVAAPVPGDDNTSYFCVVDREGNAVSFIHSLSVGFGSAFVAGSTGVLLNNRVGRGFSLAEGHPNVIEPGKRTMHTLNAYMVFDNGKPWVVGGTPGGDRQVQWNAQVIADLVDYGLDPQEAVEAPRWTHTPGTDPATIDQPFVLELDSRIPEDEVARLRARGHDVRLRPPRETGGAVQVIMIDQHSGVRSAGSDFRADGHAAAV